MNRIGLSFSPAAAHMGGDRPVHVVITLRADFYAHMWKHPSLPGRIASSQYAVQRIAAKRLREVIATPLSLAGGDAESGLVETILEDMGDAPGGLPLLEHALELLGKEGEPYPDVRCLRGDRQAQRRSSSNMPTMNISNWHRRKNRSRKRFSCVYAVGRRD